VPFVVCGRLSVRAFCGLCLFVKVNFQVLVYRVASQLKYGVLKCRNLRQMWIFMIGYHMTFCFPKCARTQDIHKHISIGYKKDNIQIASKLDLFFGFKNKKMH